MLRFVLILCLSTPFVELRRAIEVGNRNNFAIWIETLTNNNGPPLSNEVIRLNPGGKHTYNVRDEGWAGRLWPKIGCDQRGANCQFGQSIPPCPRNGCQPPAEWSFISHKKTVQNHPSTTLVWLVSIRYLIYEV